MKLLKRLAGWLLAAGLLVGVWQYSNIHDWWFLNHYHPSEQIVELADQASLSRQGRRIFYLGDPEIDGKVTFNMHCPVNEKSLVFGCYTGKIYVLKIDRAEVANVMQVTAAHEMLHAAYVRLGGSEKNEVNAWIEAYYKTLDDPKLHKIVAAYEKSEPGQRLNELHSILATQFGKLSPQLEAYYRRYFNDRQKVVAAYHGYESVLENIQQRIKQLQGELSQLRSEIEQTEQQLRTSQAELDSERRQIDRSSSAQVAAYNQKVNQYNNLASRYRNLIAEYNAKAADNNRLAILGNQLFESLDSTKFRPVGN